MNNTNETSKLVTAATKKRITTPRVSVDAKIREKFYRKVKKINKGLDKEKQISMTTAATQALKLWMEQHNV